MKKILEVKIGTHFYETEKCAGIGKWSHVGVNRILETGTNTMVADWFAECPECRREVSCFEPRTRLPIKEMFLRVKSVVENII